MLLKTYDLLTKQDGSGEQVFIWLGILRVLVKLKQDRVEHLLQKGGEAAGGLLGIHGGKIRQL